MMMSGQGTRFCTVFAFYSSVVACFLWMLVLESGQVQSYSIPWRHRPTGSRLRYAHHFPTSRSKGVAHWSRSQVTNDVWSAIKHHHYPETTELSLTCLSLTPLMSASPSAGGALAALLGASIVGIQVDRLIPSSGILAALLTAAILSNCSSMIPSSHFLYELCWSTFLPGSLALLLLALRTPNPDLKSKATGEAVTKNTKSVERVDGEVPIFKAIQTVALPFAIASIGSLVGCLTAFAVWTNCIGTVSMMQTKIGLSLADARVATACLSASFVGGSVNFFATAKLVQGSNTLLGSLATSDLIVMALYFSFLAAALQSPYFRRLFNKKQQMRQRTASRKPSETMNGDLRGRLQGKGLSRDSSGASGALRNRKASLFAKSRATVLVTSLALTIVQLANKVESWVGPWIPGTACAVIAVVAPAISNYFRHTTSNPESVGHKLQSVWTDMQDVATPMSDLMFHSLFASIGVSANLGHALRNGPACLCFSLLALSLHIVMTIWGCHLAQKWLAFPSSRNMELEDVLIASNAAIGGPATAAAFCGQMRKGPQLRGWTMAATFWGVFGYAIGTMIGVTMFRLVGGTLPIP